MKAIVLTVIVSAAGIQAPAPRAFTGVITDSECADANHGRMRMGETDPECVRACIDAHGATYVLFDGTSSFDLSDQESPARFAGRKVVVSGTLDAAGRRITVERITAAP
ncbi:MAG: hypothetical protein AB7H96_10095 [Vicinamibacterales bacterium]